MSAAKSACLRRLRKEIQHLNASPVEGCSARPLEDNILEWHVNITTPRFEGIAFHFIFKFPENYPKMPPKVVPCHYIQHQNVFGDYICLDILTQAAETMTTPYRGWSSAYTVSSLLIQLQCFLFDVERVADEEATGNQDYHDNYGVNRMYTEARNFKCKCCPHQGVSMWPPMGHCTEISQPGFYKALRPAVVRSGIVLSSDKIGQVEDKEIVQVVKFHNHRANIIMKNGQTGWCSKWTAKGVLLKQVFTSGPGVYKILQNTYIKTGKHTVGELRRGRFVNVTSIFAQGNTMCGVVPLRCPAVKLHDNFTQHKQGTVLLRNLQFHEEFPGAVVVDNSRLFVDDLHILDILFSFCDPDTLIRICKVNAVFEKRIDQNRALQEANNRCFYTLKCMKDKDTVLGVGLQSTIMDKRSRATGRRKPCLQQLHPTFDLLSREAFYQHNCRTTVYKDCTFDSFLPMYINREHGARSLPAARKAMEELWKKEDKKNRLNASRILDTLVKLMNTTVIDMMKTVMDLNVAEIQLYDSIKALEGYMGFHHLLLAFAEEEPQIVQIANDRVERFLTDEACRDKEVTPDVGELIVCLALSDYTWEEFIPKYLGEVFQRNARWTLGEYPNLRTLEPMGTISCIRLRQSYDAAKTGFRMAMFQRYFMKEIASPAELEGHPDKLKILFEDYNSRFGKPIKGAAEALQRHSRKVLACDNFFDYFELVGFVAPTAVGLCDWLRSSIKRSAKRQYHSERNILRYSNSHKVNPNCQLHMNPENCMCCGGQVFQLNKGGKPTLISEKKTRLDIAFVVDCTGSMYSWLEEAKRQMQKIITEVSAKTQFKKVRFAVVGYRDFGHEMGDWNEPTLVRGFTGDIQKIQRYVQELRVGGGGNMEALSAGLAAAADLYWHRDAMQIVIHIGDQVPHGIGGQYDTYPDGEPDGSDALRTAHVMAKQGIVIYNVDCSSNRRYSYYNTSDSALRSTFYHALSAITNGTCLNLSNADALSQIVLAAALEEEAQNKLAKIVLPLYQDILVRHEIGRFEQHVHQIYHKLKANKVKVPSSMGITEYEKYAQHQIDCLTYCMDLKQAKKMAASEYFMDFDYEVNFSAGHLAPVTEGQVRTCLKRIKDKAAQIMFHKHGCSHRLDQWKSRAFKARWANFQEHGVRREEQPWMPVRRDELRKLTSVLERAGKIASGQLKLKKNKRRGPIAKKTLKRAPARGPRRPTGRPAQQHPAPQPRRGNPWARPSPIAPQQPQPSTQSSLSAVQKPPVKRPQGNRPAPQQPQSSTQSSLSAVQKPPVKRPQGNRPAPQQPQSSTQSSLSAVQIPPVKRPQGNRPAPPSKRPALAQQQRPVSHQQQQAVPVAGFQPVQYQQVLVQPMLHQQPLVGFQQAPIQRPVFQQQPLVVGSQQAPVQPVLRQQAIARPAPQQTSARPVLDCPMDLLQNKPQRQRQAPIQQQQRLQTSRSSSRDPQNCPRTSTYMGEHGPQSIRASRSSSREPRSASQDRGQQQRPAFRPQLPMTSEPMARNQSIPLGNNSNSLSMYQNQPVRGRPRISRPPTSGRQQAISTPPRQNAPMNPNCTVLVYGVPPAAQPSTFRACLQQSSLPPPVKMGKQGNFVWCTFAHPQQAELALRSNLRIQGQILKVVRPQSNI